MSQTQWIPEAGQTLLRRQGVYLADAEASVLESVEANSRNVEIEPQGYRPV